MVDIGTLFRAVLLLFCMMIPGYILKKTRLGDDRLPLGFTNTILYVTQPAMLIVGFFRPFDAEILKTAAVVLVLSFVAHIMFFGVSLLCFRRALEHLRRVYRFSIVFGNAGYMGIPLMSMVLGDEAAVYASVYIIGFNFFAWSIGCLIYTDDRSFISPKKMLLNAATIPTFIGILLFVTNAYTWLPAIVSEFASDALVMLKNMVAPMSMMVIGMRLADLKLKGALRDKYMYLSFAMRLLILPSAVFVILWLCKLVGFFEPTAFTTVLICAATPSAALTGMFAERFAPKPDPIKLEAGEAEAVRQHEQAIDSAVAASKLVSISTLLSLLSMPIVAMLLQLL
ncbi:MAG: AEC family transporter [Clostridia bacterium]|nr:AEC family transporter [Clostridia bacterium]